MNKKNIHIVYIITKLEMGGAQKVCLSLFNGMPKTGYTPHLISGTQGTLLSSLKNNMHVYLLDSMVREFSIRSFIKEVRNFIRLTKLLIILRKKNPFLIVHTHSTKAGIIGRWAAFFARIPIRIHTVHGYAFHAYQSYYTWFAIYMLELMTSFITTHFICVSAHDTKIGITSFPLFHRKHSIIRAGVDLRQFHLQRTVYTSLCKKILFIFGTISCFKPQKNLFDLLNAFAQVYKKNSRVRLEIIGDGAKRASIEEWIKKNKLDTVITLHGWQKNVVFIMKNWNAFVLSSLWEGLPCSAVEARLLRLPVISYTIGGISELITHEKNGLLCAPQDVDALAHNMYRIITDSVLYHQMQIFSDDFTDFDSRQMVEEHLHLYKRLLMSSRQPPFFMRS